MDYWEAKAWIDLSTRPEEHLWYSIQDSTEYKKREEALIKKLEQPDFSSHASDYMKCQAYQDFKQYINNHPEYNCPDVSRVFSSRTSKDCMVT